MKECLLQHLLSLDIFYDVREGLKKFTPFSMSFVQFCLTSKVLKRFMIGMDDKFTRSEIMLPNMQDSHQSIQLFVIDGIIKLCTGNLITKICNGSLFLHYNTTYAITTSITMHFKCFLKVWQGKNWSMCKQILKLMKCGILGRSPNKWSVLLTQSM